MRGRNSFTCCPTDITREARERVKILMIFKFFPPHTSFSPACCCFLPHLPCLARRNVNVVVKTLYTHFCVLILWIKQILKAHSACFYFVFTSRKSFSFFHFDFEFREADLRQISFWFCLFCGLACMKRKSFKIDNLMGAKNDMIMDFFGTIVVTLGLIFCGFNNRW